MESSTFLLQHFDRLAEAPGGIAKLRALVLQLAITGKLLPQSKADELAAKLVARIRTEKAQITKRPVTSTPIDRSEVEVQIPAEWEWIKLGDLCSKTGSGSTPRGGKTAYTNSGIPFLRSQNVYDDGLRLAGVANITPKIHEQMSGTVIVPGDLLLNITGGSIGRCAIVPDTFTEGNVSQHVAILRPAIADMSGYLHLVVLSPHFQTVMLGSQTGAGREGLPKNRMDEILIPLPPLAEQRRIVAKVEELMGLCDALEAAQQEREAVRTHLRISALHQLTSPGPDSKSAAFVLQHLHSLAAVPEDFADIRESVLELAALGQLTRQLATDGLASDLLRRIGNPSAKKRKPAEQDEESEPLPEIPASWVWTTVDALAAHDEYAITDGPFGANLKTDHYIEQPGYRVIRLQNIGRGYFKEEHRSYLRKEHFERLSKHHIFSGDLVVAGLVDPLVRCSEVPAGLGPTLVKADCYRFKVHPAMSSRFVLHYLNSGICQRFAAVHHHGMTLVRIGLGNFRNIPIPLPPLAEQRRIVAKVDELMAVLDALEAALTTARTTAASLLAATIAKLHAA